MSIIEISATGTRGSAKSQLFKAKPDSKGMYVLNRKTSSPSKGNTTNHAKNKVSVATLEEAFTLLSTNDYLINVVDDRGKRALRSLKNVKVQRI